MISIIPHIVTKPLRKIAAVILLFCATPAFSLMVDGLYDAEVVVKDQSSIQVLNAKKAGLAQVLVKVTGQSQSLHNARIRAALINPEAYLKQFSFATHVINDQPQAVIKLAFDKPQVDQLISDSGLPLWGADRAAVLVWLVEDKQGVRQIVNDDGHPMVAQIMDQAQQRGMPLLWPLLDLEDQVSIDAGALWGLFGDTIKTASNRYQADAVLVGRMFQDSQQLWRVEWNFWLDDIEHKWSSEGSDLAALVDPLQDRLSSRLVEKFALATSESRLNLGDREAVLRVDQVARFDDYVELQAMLQGLAGVQSVHLTSADSTTLEFLIVAQSNLAQVKSTIDLKRRLRLVIDADSEASIGSKGRPLWHYQWH